MKLSIVLLVVTISLGCAVEAPAPPGVPFATQIVWQQQYVMGDAPPPAVYWVVGAALNCADGQGWTPAPSKYTLPPCVAGLYYQDEKTAYVALPLGAQISDTSFAHELCHAFMWATTGDGDENHVGPCFNEPGNYVVIAKDALARVDL